MEKVKDIYDNLKELIININPKDIDDGEIKTVYSHPEKPEQARKFYSKSRLDQKKKLFIFAYTYRFLNRVEIALNTGKNPVSTFKDPKELIEKPGDILKRFSTFYGIIVIKPKELESEYYYEDIIYLVKQSYGMLIMHR